MNVAELQRDKVDIARLATFALRPELQAHAQATDDKPRDSKVAGPRPDRATHPRHDKPLW